MTQQPSQEFYLPSGEPKVEHFVRFSTTAEELSRMLAAARAVGIAVEPITDPEVAGETYAAQAHKELAGGLMYGENQSRPNPAWCRKTAKKRVASGDTMMLFTTTGPQAMKPFIDEYNRRFRSDEKK
ncbi:MAG: hypothetical protein WBO35_04000 [Candidatus Saccharimonadales bacterium]